MNVDLLSQFIMSALKSKGGVCVPYVGTFSIVNEPARITSNGYVMIPPAIKVDFQETFPESPDVTIAELFAAEKKIQLSTAINRIEVFCKEFKKVLQENKCIVLPGFGKVRATKENDLFFVPETDLELSGEFFCLEPIHLRASEQESAKVEVTATSTAEEAVAAAAVMEETPTNEETSAVAAVATAPTVATAAAAIVVATAEASAPEENAAPTVEAEGEAVATAEEPVPIVETPAAPAEETAPAEEAKAQKPRKKRIGAWGIAFIVVAVLIVLAAGAFVAISRYYPGSTDFLLFTPEELELFDFL
ncbi:MAG: hypothetical protein HUJ95_01465 [Bacteroidales bacterium]|nr:hypothetical protein [Bacteroidales bacterium]